MGRQNGNSQAVILSPERSEGGRIQPAIQHQPSSILGTNFQFSILICENEIAPSVITSGQARSLRSLAINSIFIFF